MARAMQVTLSEESRPDMLAHVAQVLGDAEVNNLACLATTSGRRGVYPSHRGQCRQRRKGVCEGGLRYSEADVLEVELSNTPGALKFDSKLADKNINITFGYQTSTKGSRKASMVWPFPLWKRLPAFCEATREVRAGVLRSRGVVYRRAGAFRDS